MPLACLTNYVLINDADGVSCKPCSDTAGMDNCYSTASNAAVGCKSGYYLTAGTCGACDG